MSTLDFRPIAAFFTALFIGGLLGYLAQAALEPDNAPGYPTLAYASNSQEGFPYKFQSREEALRWLHTQVVLLEHHGGPSLALVVDEMKETLARAVQRPSERIDRSFFLHVREEVELLRRELSGDSTMPAVPAPATVTRPKADE